MGLETIAIAGLVINVASQVFSGVAAKEEAVEEAERITDQGDLARAENEAEAERVEKERSKFIARQKLAYLKGGVTLEGSPLIILEESEEEAEKEVQAIKARGIAQQSLAHQKAASTESSGSARLFGSLGSAISTGVSGTVALKQAGLF